MTTHRARSIVLLVLLAGCARRAPPPDAGTQSGGVARSTTIARPTPIALPGSPGRVAMDYLAFEPKARRLWVPAGNTAKVDVVEVEGHVIHEVGGFATLEREVHGEKRGVGPSSATVGDGVVYVGNRADSRVCAIDSATLERAGCAELPSMPDGLAYVGATQEVWVTAPGEDALLILDVADPRAPKPKGKIALEGEPEGYAVDQARGVFYTNLEDEDRTLAIDVATRKITATWAPGCGDDGPRGLALAAEERFLFVACTRAVVALDAGHDGRKLGAVDTGAGVDNIDYSPASRRVYAAAGQDARLTIARVDARGALQAVRTATTALGARVVITDDRGTAYVADSAHGRLIAVPAE